jgi:CheY-like chemotaxis protein
VEVASDVGRGTTFKVFLPLAHEGAAAAPAPAAPPRAAGGSETLLLVEDEEPVRALARRTLQDHGYAVLEAGDGLAALAVCQSHPGPIDLVVTDVVMPILSGPEFVERLASQRPGTKVLYISGYTDSAVVRHGMADDANFVQKAFTPDDLALAVRAALDGPAAQAPAAAAVAAP